MPKKTRSTSAHKKHPKAPTSSLLYTEKWIPLVTGATIGILIIISLEVHKHSRCGFW